MSLNNCLALVSTIANAHPLAFKVASENSAEPAPKPSNVAIRAGFAY